jgi:hypothetical protein
MFVGVTGGTSSESLISAEPQARTPAQKTFLTGKVSNYIFLRGVWLMY